MSLPERAIEVRPTIWQGGPWLVGILGGTMMFVIVFVLGMLISR